MKQQDQDPPLALMLISAVVGIALTAAVILPIVTGRAEANALPPPAARLEFICDYEAGIQWAIAVTDKGVAMWPRLQVNKGIVPIKSLPCAE